MRRHFALGLVIVLAGTVALVQRAGAAAVMTGKKDVLALVAQGRMRLEASEIGQGLELLREAVAADPTDPEVTEEYGLALADVGLSDQAVEQLQKVKPLSPAGEATLGIILAQSARDGAQLDRAVLHLRQGLTAFPQGQQARLTLVQALLRLGRGDVAWDALQPLLSDRPGDPRLELMAGQALRAGGKYDEAIAYLKRASEDPDLHQRATLELVETLAAAGKNREAADLLGGFLNTEGATLTGLSRWATLLARAGERAKAKSVLDDVLAKDPKFRDALLLKALLDAMDGDSEGAEALYRRALAVDPDDVEASLGLIRVLVDQRRFQEARHTLDPLWKKLDGAKPRDDDACTEVVQERASLELLDHHPDAARPWLDRLLTSAVGRRSLALWGEYFRQREAFGEGVAWLKSARLSDDPGVARLRSGLSAEFLLATGDREGAEKELKPLLAGNPEDVLTALGALERRRVYDQLVARAREAAARFPDNPDIEFILAAGLERSGAWDEAVTRFRALIAKHPDNAASLNYLGYMFADKGVNLAEAKDLIGKAVKQEPTSGAYLDSLGWVYFRLGQLDLAEKYLSEGLRLEPYDPTVQEHLAELYFKQGLREKAEAAFRRALELKPEEAGQKERIEAKLVQLSHEAKH
ncbi:MAG: tetratricopeptide repeat protein [Acidobacteriota bacterium]